MPKRIELRRHTDNDGDILTTEGVKRAVEIGGELDGPYELVVSTGAQRATQTAACFLAGLGMEVPAGVVVDTGFRSDMEDRWREIYSETGSGELQAFLDADPEFVKQEGAGFAQAVARLAEQLSENGRALVVGHSPTTEAAVWGATGEFVGPLGKGEGVVIVSDADGYRLEG